MKGSAMKLMFSLLAAVWMPGALQASPWKCSATAGTPSECPETLDGDYSPSTHTCLMKLYTCGQYDSLSKLIEGKSQGLVRQENFFLGSAYFGLSNRTHSKALKCFYTKAAKNQLEEFLRDVQDDPKSAATLGSEADMDLLYHATRTYKTLSTETGCAESSYTEAAIRRKARLYTHQRMNNLIHNVSSELGSDGKSPTPAAEAEVKAGFDAMRSTLNTFVTKASQLESRYQIYSGQLASAKDQTLVITEILKEIFGSENVSVSYNGEVPMVSITSGIDDAILSDLEDKVSSITRKTTGELYELEGQLDKYFKKNSKYYNEIKTDTQIRIQSLLQSVAFATNTFKNSGAGSTKISNALALGEGKLGSLVTTQEATKRFFQNEISKCATIRGEKPWFCAK